MSALPDFTIETPSTPEEAVVLCADAGAAARYLAGGTDFVPNLHRGLEKPQTVVYIGGIDELRRLDGGGDGLAIGAGVTLSDLAAEAAVRDRYPALAEAAEAVAGPSHRNVATLGGNLCLDTRCVFYNQSEWWRAANGYCLKRDGDTCHVAPTGKRCHATFSGDVAPALLVLGAEAEVAGPAGRRRVPLAELYRDDGVDHLTLAPGELLVAVHVGADAAPRSGYRKSRLRRAIDFPSAGVAVALARNGQKLGKLSVALTGIGSRPVLLDGLEELGVRPDRPLLAEVTRRIGRAIKPLRTSTIPANYRRHVSTVLTVRLVRELWEDAKDTA